MLGLFQVIRVDVIRGYRQLGIVIEEIIEQDLAGGHGEEGQEQAGADHGEHIAEIGTQAHEQIFHSIAESLAALDDAGHEFAQAFLEQNDIGGFLGHVHGVIDRDADIRRLQGRGVVYAVAQIADGQAFTPQFHDDLLFLPRGEAGANRSVLGLFVDFLVG